MEYYNLRELRKNLSSRLQRLGVSPKFLENPAYWVSYDTIQELILGLVVDDISIIVGEEKGKIEFYDLPSSGNASSMTISFVDPNTFRVIRVANLIHCSNVVEMVASISDNAVTQLKPEYGLREMSMVGGDDSYPDKVKIWPLSAEDIEDLIQREDDLKVQEGLRSYVRDRETYSYDSSTDPTFVCTSGQDALVMSRKKNMT